MARLNAIKGAVREMNGRIEHIKHAVRKTMADQFGPVKVRDVKIKDETDQFGDDVLRIDVVFYGPPLDPKGVAGFVRTLRPRLLHMQEFKFPILSFISSAEQK
jgi:hypothetical protein